MPRRDDEVLRAIQVLRATLADSAETIADLAESTAEIFEKAALRGDADRRLMFAAWEREIARVERHNAVKLRNASGVFLDLDRLPVRPAQ
jgi:hypothetical protein